VVAEHSFITTMDGPEAIRAALQFLQQGGFATEPQTAFPLDNTWNVLEVRRGKVGRVTRKAIADWPQRVRIEWDRGKVDVAAMITPPAQRTWNPRLTNSGAPKLSKGQQAAAEAYLLAIATSLELLLSRRADKAQSIWVQLEGLMQQERTDCRRRGRWRLAITLIFFALCIAGVIAAVARSSS